ncbi:tape measure protein [Gordonia phage Niagara]|nr:tape measure protein [Gordonia phage Niagara]
MLTTDMIIAIHARTAQAQRQLAQMQGQLKALERAGIDSTNSVGRSVNGLDRTSERARANSNKPWFSQMRASGSQIQWVGRQMSVGLTLPLIGAMAMGTKFALDFEKNMTRVSKVYGDSALQVSLGSKGMQEEVDALGRAFVELGNKYGQSAADVAEIGSSWAAAGSSGRALAKQTELTMQTMVLGEMTAAEATEALISIQAQWGVVTESNQDKIEAAGGAVRNRAKDEMSLTNILRQLNAVENETGAKMQDLVKGYQRASGTARSAGVETGELAAMIAALVPAAGGAAEAGTALRTMLNRVMTPMNDAKEVLAKMNIDVTKSDWVTKSATERLEVMAKAYPKLTGAQQQWLGFVIAGRWHVNRFMILMNAMGNANSYYGKTLKTLSDQARVTRIAEKELEAVLTSNPQRMKQAGAIIQNSLMKAMIPLVPMITQVALWFGKLANAFAEIPPHIRTTILAVALFLGVLGPLIIFLGMIKLSIGMLAPAFIAMAKFVLLPLKPFMMMFTLVGKGLTALPIAAIASARGMLLGFMFMIKSVAMVGAAVGMVAPIVSTALGMAATAIVAWAPTVAALPAMIALAVGKIALVIDALMALMRFRVTAGMAVITTLFAAGPIAWRTALAVSTGGIALVMDALMVLLRVRLVAWFAATKALFFAGPIAWAAAMRTGMAAVYAFMVAGLAAKLTATRVWAVASALIHKIHWATVVGIAKAGMIALVTNVRKLAPLMLKALASPWVLAIGAIVLILTLFKDQVKAAITNVVDYFRNLPAGIKQGLAPIGRMFTAIKNGILKAFNALPEGIKNAMLAVINVVKAAAMAVYRLFSYLNPFAHHSPSLVENVTNGMAVVNDQFANSARVAESNINRIHSAIKSLQGAGAGMVTANDQAKDAEFRGNAARAGGASALPQYDTLNRQVAESKRALESMNTAIEAQEDKVKSVQKSIKRYDQTIKEMNKSLETTKAIQASVGDALDSAKARFDRYSNAQVAGYGAAEDAIFANELAQKRLQLQIKRMESAAGGVDSVTDSYAKLQGQIEMLQGKQAELRAGGAGSDILGPYDDMIGKLKSEQGALGSGNTGPGAAIAQLTTQLEALQRQAEIMDLEKALKFDSLNRSIEKFKSNTEELSYGEIMNGLDSSRNSVNALSLAYDSLGYQLKGQEYQIAQVEAARAAMQDQYDLENDKLSIMKESYDAVEESIRAGEQAMQDFSSAIDETIQRQEALERAQEAAKKKKKKGAGAGADDEYTAAMGFEDAGQADFAIPGSSNAIMREGGMGNQAGEIDAFTDNLQKSIEESLGGMNPFAPVMAAWDRTKQWFSQNVSPVGKTVGAMFAGIGKSIQAGFNGGEPAVDALTRAFAEGRMGVEEYRKRLGELGADTSTQGMLARLREGVQEKDNVFYKIGQWVQQAWEKIEGFGKLAGDFLGKLFGPDLKSTLVIIKDGLYEIWTKASGPLNELKDSLGPFLKMVGELAVIVGGALLMAFEVVWEMLNGALGPAFSFIADLIGGLILVITGIVKVITGAFNIVLGTVKLIFSIFKGVFTFIKGLFSGDIDMSGFEGVGAALKQIFVDGIGTALGGLWTIVKGIWDSIVSLFKNAAKIVWNVVYGFVKGIIDFFKTLWDVLVGHSIVPDTINSIIDWFKELPGKLPGIVWGVITKVIGFFLKLPLMIGKALLTLGGFLFNAFITAMAWLLPKLPGMIWNVIKFFATLPFKIIAALAGFGMKLLGWIGQAIAWLVPQLPGIIWNLITFFATLPFKILGALGGLGLKLLGWIWDAISWLVPQLPGAIWNIITFFATLPFKIIGALVGFGGKLFEWAKNAFIWLAQRLPGIVQGVIDFAKEIPGNFIRGLGVIGRFLWEWMKKGWDFLVNELPGIVAGFLKWIAGIPGMLLGKLGDGAKVLYNYGKDMIQGLMNGTAGLLKKLGDWFLDKIPGWIKTPFKKALGIASPSKVFAGYGQNIGEGLILGIDSMQRQVEQASVGIAAAADKGEVAGMAISAVADTSSVGGSVSELGSAVAATGPVGVDAAMAPTADVAALQADLDAAKAVFDAFALEMESKTAVFAATISASFGAMSSGAAASLNNISTVGVSSFTALQTSVVTIVTTMVTTVNGQLQLLISYVTAFGTSFTAAWNAAWTAWMSQTTTSVDHTVNEWTRMATGMQSTLDNSIRPMFDEMKLMLTELEEAYTSTVNNVGTTWDGIKEKTAAPARFVINDVYNTGLRGAWNKFNEMLGIEALPEYTAKFREGGPVWGPGTGTSDSINAKLSRGEHVITAAEVRAAGGHAAVEAQRRYWRSGGGYDGAIQAFRNGGAVEGKARSNLPLKKANSNAYITTPMQQAMWDAVSTAFPNVALHSGTRTFETGAGFDNHMQGRALDLSPIPEVAKWIYEMNKKQPVLELIFWPLSMHPTNLHSGAPLDYGAATNAQHMDHVHWAMNSMVDNEGKVVSMVGPGDAINPVNYVKLIEDAFKEFKKTALEADPKFKGGIGQWPPKSVDHGMKAVDYLRPFAEKLQTNYSSGNQGNIPYNLTAGVEQWRDLAKKMLIMQGESVTYVDRLLMQMQSESGGNPNAINLWDSNAAKGTPSKGLMQVIDPTFQANRDPRLPNNVWDPAANIAASIRYTRGRYGSLSAWSGVGYDSGGILPPGFTLANNQTGGPEAILTDAQWSAMYTAAANSNQLEPEDVQHAMEMANKNTGNTADKQAAAIIKGMDVWQRAWTPEVFDATDKVADAADKVAASTETQAAGTVLLSKSIGKYNDEIAALSKLLNAVSTAAMASTKVTITYDQQGNQQSVNNPNQKVDKNGKPIFTVDQPTFSTWAPVFDALAGFLETMPYAERDWAADNPVPGESQTQRKLREAQNMLVNFGKGSYNVLKEVGPPLLRHTGIIGSAVEKLIQEDGTAWTTAIGMIATGNQAGWAIIVPLALKAVGTLLPLILAAILDIVPALIRAIVRFLTQFMPDSVYAYADMAAAEAAVQNQQDTGETAMGQGQRYPTAQSTNVQGNAPINIYVYGVELPNITDGDDASEFVDQLKLLAANE